MFRVVVVTTLLLAAIAPGGVATDANEPDVVHMTLLATFDLDVLAFEQHFFSLAYDPGMGQIFEQYVFKLGAQPVGAAAIRVQLIDGLLGFGQTVCAGPMTSTPLLPVHVTCYGFLPGHHYRVDSVSTTGGSLQLYGFNPIA